MWHRIVGLAVRQQMIFYIAVPPMVETGTVTLLYCRRLFADKAQAETVDGSEVVAAM